MAIEEYLKFAGKSAVNLFRAKAVRIAFVSRML